MKIAFYYEHGEIPEIGTGHKYRCKTIAEKLVKHGHQIVEENPDVLVIDHLFEQTKRIKEAKERGIRVVLIDGTPSDASLADVSISAFYNKAAQYTGLKYMAFPTNTKIFYKPNNSKKVFVSMGGYDACNLTQLAVQAVRRLGYEVLATKSINSDLEPSVGIEIFTGTNYFKAMEECVAGITAGGLTMFQALYFGLPCVCIPQYEHQSENIDKVSSLCFKSEPNVKHIENNLHILLREAYSRDRLSKIARDTIDDQGVNRICDLIEELQ